MQRQQTQMPDHQQFTAFQPWVDERRGARSVHNHRYIELARELSRR